jgi:hypothetical protein
MKAAGESIGSYRILSVTTTTLSHAIYTVDRTGKSSMAALLVLWSTISLPDENSRSAFLKQAEAGNIHYGDATIPILNEGIEEEHPYFTLAYSPANLEIIREQADYIDKELSNARSTHGTEEPDGEEINSTFLRAFAATLSFEQWQDTPTDPSHPRIAIEAASEPTIRFSSQKLTTDQLLQNHQSQQEATASTVPYTNYKATPAARKSRRALLLIPAIILVLLLLFLAIFGRSTIYPIIPAASATITITPTRPELNLIYNFTVVTDTPNTSNEVQGRKISFSSSQLTQTVDATGQGQTKPTEAKGSIVLSQISFSDGATSHTLGIISLSDADGVSITTDKEAQITQGGSVTIPAHASSAGSGGNIFADDLDGPVDLYDALTDTQNGTGYVTNPDAFSGGTDATPFTFVQQSDIDGVTKPFVNKVTNGLKQKVMQQVKTGESLAGEVQCSSAISSDHHAQDHAASVTVKDRITCSGTAYNKQAFNNIVLQTYRKSGTTDLGSGYTIVGATHMDPIPTSTDDNPPQLSVNVDAIWSYQYNQAQKQSLAASLTSKTQSAAQQILRARHDIQHATITTQGIFGNALPLSSSNITITVQKVSGLS